MDNGIIDKIWILPRIYIGLIGVGTQYKVFHHNIEARRTLRYNTQYKELSEHSVQSISPQYRGTKNTEKTY